MHRRAESRESSTTGIPWKPKLTDSVLAAKE